MNGVKAEKYNFFSDLSQKNYILMVITR